MEQDGTIAKLVRNYSANKATLASVQLELRDLGQLLSELGNALTASPDQILIGDDSLRFRTDGNPVPLAAVAEVHALLEKRREAIQERARMEEALREMGLGNLIGP